MKDALSLELVFMDGEAFAVASPIFRRLSEDRRLGDDRWIGCPRPSGRAAAGCPRNLRRLGRGKKASFKRLRLLLVVILAGLV